MHLSPKREPVIGRTFFGRTDGPTTRSILQGTAHSFSDVTDGRTHAQIFQDFGELGTHSGRLKTCPTFEEALILGCFQKHQEAKQEAPPCSHSDPCQSRKVAPAAQLLEWTRGAGRSRRSWSVLSDRIRPNLTALWTHSALSYRSLDRLGQILPFSRHIRRFLTVLWTD